MADKSGHKDQRNLTYSQVEKTLSKLSPFILFIPFLIFFLWLTWLLNDHQIIGDEVRYLKFTRNLLNGFYSPPPPNINLWSGPGYPLIILPFVALKVPYSILIALNAVFYYMTLVFLHKALLQIVSFKKAFILSSILGFYYVTYNEIGSVLTEHLTLCLCALLLYTIVGPLNRLRKIFLGGLILGYLALTKVMFGYVIIALIVLTALLSFVVKKRNMRLFLYLSLVAFTVNLPYLTYTYLLTSKPLYWSNAGGMSLYWMSTPHKGEFGDWHDVRFISDCGLADYIPCNKEQLSTTHQADIDYIESLPIIERDNAYKKLAFQNIKKYPFKFLRNCIANISRLFFGIPRSYIYQMDISIIYIIPNGILMTCMILGLFISLRRFSKLKDELLFILMLVFIYMGLSTLGSAYLRFLYVIMPWILWWLANVFEAYVVVKWK